MASLMDARKRRVDIPDIPGAWIEFRPVTGPALEAAVNVRSLRTFEAVKPMLKAVAEAGLPLESLLPAGQPRKATPPSEGEDWIDAYLGSADACALVDSAFAGWSFDPLPAGTKPSENMDAQTLSWAARIVVEMNVRPPSNGQPSGTS